MSKNKYINLIYKDLIMCKKPFIYYLLFSIIIPLLLPIEILNEYFLVPAVMILGYLLCLINVIVIYQDEKSMGTCLLVTTPYSRKSIVVSRYLLCGFAALLCMFFYFGIDFLVTGKLHFVSFTGIIMFFILCLFISTMLPVSFKFKPTIASSIILLIIFTPTMLFAEFLRTENVKSLSISVGMTLISILLIMLSINISLRIYSKKDL